jgi:hypothetical protein
MSEEEVSTGRVVKVLSGYVLKFAGLVCAGIAGYSWLYEDNFLGLHQLEGRRALYTLVISLGVAAVGNSMTPQRRRDTTQNP